MKNKFRKLFLLALLSGVSAPALLRAQNYSVDWHSVDGGGGTSRGGQFSITGSIGQCSEVQMTGGTFAVDSGSWASFSVVQTIGAPTLRIQVTAANTLIVAWPASSTGFALQQNSNLATANWLPVNNPVVPVEGENQVTIPITAGDNYYRLISTQ